MSGYPSRTPGELGELIDRIANLEAQMSDLQAPTKEAYSNTVANLNTVQSSYSDTGTSGPALNTSANWQTWANFTLNVSKGKTWLKAQIIASGAFADMITGGVTSVAMRIKVTYPNGDILYSPEFPSAKDAGASVVNNVMTGSFFVNRNGLSPAQGVVVEAQFKPLNPSAFPSTPGNFANMSAIYVSSNL